MKKIIPALLLLFILSSCSNVKFLQVMYGNARNWEVLSSKELPAQVKVSFEKKYPGIATVYWMHPTKGKYVANFTIEGKIRLVVFSATGQAQDEENYEYDDYYFYEEYDDYWEMDSYD